MSGQAGLPEDLVSQEKGSSVCFVVQKINTAVKGVGACDGMGKVTV